MKIKTTQLNKKFQCFITYQGTIYLFEATSRFKAITGALALAIS